MGSCCGGRGSTAPKGAGAVTGWQLTTMTGEVKGPYLTSTEARIAASEAGGGVIKPIREATH
jgi:hypothetical protein